MVHIHLRTVAGGRKDIDGKFEAAVIRSSRFDNCNSYNGDMFGPQTLEIEITPPSIFSLCMAYYKGLSVQHLTCSFCGAWHTDLGVFNVNPHKKHLCGSCGYFFDVDWPVSCSNALAALPNNWNFPGIKNVVAAANKICLISRDYDKIDVWSWSPAAVWTMPSPEIANGIHVHAYRNGQRVIDETYGEVRLDGDILRWQELVIESLSRCDIPYNDVIARDIKNYFINVR